MGHDYLLWMPSTFIYSRGILMRQERRYLRNKTIIKVGPCFFVNQPPFLLSVLKVFSFPFWKFFWVKPVWILRIRDPGYKLPCGLPRVWSASAGYQCFGAILGQILPGTYVASFILLGFKGRSEVSVTTFRSRSRNNGFSKVWPQKLRFGS